jgi:hypothetical protein
MQILFIGDIVGSPGRAAVKGLLPGLRKARGIDVVIANAENAAGGSGITQRVARDLFQSGCDILTSGDHVWRRPEIVDLLHTQTNILRPLNFPKMTPVSVLKTVLPCPGVKVGVICLLGRVLSTQWWNLLSASSRTRSRRYRRRLL